ncbi:hypothetical protein E2I22_07035 [Vibrio vulnificus]|uniref:Uncharacterized protein n=1 Tax=Vibrio vulnificus (strain CMCP6) TaxID=216895 RepID=A0A3Q0L6D9_VIBVU|nr:hypothetical protein VV1_2681 [Vibrio vulnificus CMCP6]MCA0780542.1 DUF4407 domain-containing protein [Vibrio vulnificus]QBN13990.1 hypothetical protein E2I22_07035 [Vibrio vulnificus]HAS6381815.1 hypothetical protein [Vibrio vulnificus]HDY7510685.1 hypothetical protein [Vibrio vulnificus]
MYPSPPTDIVGRDKQKPLEVLMQQKLGHVMSFSRMFSFVAFLTATFAWILSMYALFTVSIVALVVSLLLYLRDKFIEKYHSSTSKEKRA